MSDDEYYGGDDYDDFDDLLWEDGGEDDIAGDLAEHTLHSPVWQDDPGYELQQAFSDWDYYSDDYFDDDPSLLKNNPQEGSPLAKQEKAAEDPATTKRGRKRKYTETKDIPPLNLDDRSALPQTIQGTVWAERRPENSTTYKVGGNRKVALLKDWREVFKSTQPHNERSGKSSGKGKLHHDESWANEMSLEDMGLMTAKGRTTSSAGDIKPEFTKEEDEAEEEAVEQDEMTEVEDNFVSDLPGEEDGLKMAKAVLAQTNIPATQMFNGASEDLLADIEPETPPRKRQKRTVGPSPLATGAQAAEEEPPQNAEMPLRQSNGLGQRGKGRPTNSDVSSMPPSPKPAIQNLLLSKKRRASPTDSESPSEAAGSTASSRAKRVASSKLSTKPDVKGENVPPLPTKRGTRSRRKA